MKKLNIEGIYTADELYKDVFDLYEGKSATQYTTGFNNLDQIYKIVKPCFTVITGCPNSGKSTFCYDLCIHLAKKYKFKFAIFSPEHSLSTNIQRLAEKYHKKPFAKMFDDRMTKEELGEAIVFLNKHFWFIDRKADTPNIDWILDKAYQLHDAVGLDCLVLDPYNEIDPTRELREDEHISLVISKIKRFNRETNTLSYLIAHPNKQIRNAEGKFVVDSLYSISGSAHFNNKCDVGLILSRNYETEKTDIRVAKVRENDVYGNIGIVDLHWSKTKRGFVEMDDTRSLDDFLKS